MTTLATAFLLAAMKSSDAIAIVLNARTATSPTRYDEARRMVLEDARAGCPVQQFVVSALVLDAKRAKKYAEASRPAIRAMAERRGNPLAWYLLSLESNDIDFLRRAAEGGNVQALNAMGTIVAQEALSRKGISTNEIARLSKYSFDCFRKAAAQKDPNGFVNLGAAYTAGMGCRQELSLAFECYRSAAEAGHPEAMENLSACYDLGHGVPRDRELALWWHMKALSVRGDKAAERWLKEGR